MTTKHFSNGTSLILLALREILMEQINNHNLVRIPPGLIDRAETRLQYLKDLILTSSDQLITTEVDEYHYERGALIYILERLQDERDELIWYHAYYQKSSDYPNCTESEQKKLDMWVAEIRGDNLNTNWMIKFSLNGF